MRTWTHDAPVALAAFLASLVEFVEALTIVLAVGATRGWRSALAGAASAAVVLALLVAAFGPALQRIPFSWMQAAVGALMLAFGLRWLRKAILRSAGVMKLHDEAAIYAKETRMLAAEGRVRRRGIDKVGFLTSFNGTLVEGLEVVFIVIAAGAAGRALAPAAAGAALAAALVVIAGFALHRPLARVPENTLKFAVGVILTSFGVFWVGEGLGLAWPGNDGSIAVLLAATLALSRLLVARARKRAGASHP